MFKKNNLLVRIASGIILALWLSPATYAIGFTDDSLLLLVPSIVGAQTTEDTTGDANYFGNWSGQWTNTTFGSSGPLTMSASDNGNGTINITADLGGMVGGLLDPDPVTITANLNPDGSINYSGTIPMLGPLTFSVSSSGAISASAPAIDLPGFSHFTANGSISSSKGSLNYTVFFSPTGSASGTASASKL